MGCAMNATTLNVRVDAKLKKDVESCLDEMGLNMSTAITIYLKQIAKLRAIPFQVTANPRLNRTTIAAITIAAIEEAERIAYDPSVKGYRDIDSLMESLNS